MNIIFLTISRVGNIAEKSIYCDLLRYFKANGHQVWTVYPRERRFNLPTEIYEQLGIHLIGVKTFNLQKTNVIEKGLGTMMVERQFKKAINKYIGDVSFDLILYSTPPITFNNLVAYLKKKNPQAVSYLLLKDIFPQNAVDLGMFSKKSLFYKYFRRQERRIFLLSDYIGCMSPANVKYIIKHNEYLDEKKIEVAPNSVDIDRQAPKFDMVKKEKILQRYNIPTDRIVFVYGGNLGKPQGIDFLIKCMEANKNREDCHFIIVGNGTEKHKLDKWYKDSPKSNVTLLERLPKEEYNDLVKACHVGLIFLDHRFTIPNYPSRLLAYLEYHLPVICATDRNTDIGRIAEQNGYGFWCESIREEDFTKLVDKFVHHPSLIESMGDKGFAYLCENYDIQNTYDVIMQHFSTKRT